MAPPKKEISPLERQVMKMSAYGMARAEIADCLGISERTLMRRGLERARKRGIARLRRKLRKAQLDAAIKDKNPAMLIWLGKQMLEQREPAHGIEISGTIEHELAAPDELRSDILRRLARIAAASGASGAAGEITAPDAPVTGDELRVLGPGESTGTTG